MEQLRDRSYYKMCHHYEWLLHQKSLENKNINNSKSGTYNDQIGID